MMDKRVLVSFDDICPYQCKHCYTLDIPRTQFNRSIPEIVKSIEQKDFDVIYVSQRRDNFVNPDDGILLCEQLFECYNSNIFIITRNIFDENQVERLLSLKEKMEIAGKEIVVASSVFATKSYSKSENPMKVPSPYERMKFIKRLKTCGVKALIIIRPVFPEYIIPVEELYELVDICKKMNVCIVSSGLALNDDICWRLNLNPCDMEYMENVHYLEGAMEGKLKFLNVEDEMKKLKQYCEKEGVTFFDHTIQALNYIISGQ